MRVLVGIVLVVLFFGLLDILFLRLFAKEWWKIKKIRLAAWSLPATGLLGAFLWGLGGHFSITVLLFAGAILTALAMIIELCLILSLPFSGFVHFVNYLFDTFQNDSVDDNLPIDNNRRKVLKSVAAAIPLVSLSTGASGVIQTFGSVNVFRKPVHFDDLPEDLDGFRILHLSDLHLRHYVTLDDLENVLLEAEKFSPDIVLVTGDIADDLDLLPDALKLLDQLKTPYGSFATLGNHEYFRGVGTVRHLFGKSSVPLFVNDGVNLKVGNSSLFIGGIDDPVRMGAKETQFFKYTINETLKKESSADFKVLMSHRPDALDYASTVGIDLILAGHTHGGQMGFGGRSLLESSFPDRYLWGDYSIDKSKLYTTSGMGHWFPFRLGCPTEAPIIELVKS